MGESIADKTTYTTIPGTDRMTGECIQFGPTSHVGSALLASRGAFLYGGVFATFGYTPTQNRDTWLPGALASDADVVVVLAGTNTDANFRVALSNI